jgi:hypothetical protein
MAARFWVAGGTGDWNSTTNWSATTGGASGASVPGSADTATLNASSGAGTVTLDISPTIQTLTCTGFTGTLAFGTNTISLNSTGTIFAGATTMTVTGTPLIICTNSSATARTITPTAVTEANSISFRITAGTGNLTITGSQAVRDLDFTDGVNPTGYAGAYAANAITVYGNLKASTGMTQTAGAAVMTFAATSGTKTINTAGVTFDRSFTFNGVGGIWQLQSALTSGSTRTIILTNGALDLAGYTLTVGVFFSNNSNTRSIAFGTGKIVVLGSGAGVFHAGTTTGLTVTGTPLVQATYSGSVGTRTIVMGPYGEANAISVDITAGSDIISLAAGGAGAYKNINATGFTGTLTFTNNIAIYGNFDAGGATATAGSSSPSFNATSGTKTIRTNGLSFPANLTFDGVGGTWALQDALAVTSTLTQTNGTVQLKNGVTSVVGAFATSGTNQKYLQSTLAGTQATLSQASGTVDASYLTIKDINAVGGATWNAFVDQSNIDAGNVDGWNFGISPIVGGNEYTYQLRSFTQPRRF